MHKLSFFRNIHVQIYICISIYLSKYQYVLDGCGVQPGKDGICGWRSLGSMMWVDGIKTVQHRERERQWEREREWERVRGREWEGEREREYIYQSIPLPSYKSTYVNKGTCITPQYFGKHGVCGWAMGWCAERTKLAQNGFVFSVLFVILRWCVHGTRIVQHNSIYLLDRKTFIIYTYIHLHIDR